MSVSDIVMLIDTYWNGDDEDTILDDQLLDIMDEIFDDDYTGITESDDDRFCQELAYNKRI